ncbi:MAG: DNA primase [Candidatus Korobacteraceae bacterium]
MAQPGDFASTVKQQADIVRIVGEYVKLRKSGAQNYSGLCPFHQEKTASFSVHAGNQFFHCFGCNAGGDVFTFVQKIENITFPEAVRMVAEKLGIPMPKVSYSSPEEARQAKQRGTLLDIHERACAFFQEQLKRPEAAHAREYLKARGLSPEAIAEFRVGYAPESGFLLRDALRGQFDEETMRESGLFSWKDKGDDDQAQQKTALYSKFRNRVMFPICTEQGKVIAFTGRTLASDEKSGPKYLNSPETPIYSKSRVLFNLDKAKEAIRKLDYAILVEGQMDCISVYSAGLHNVIASSGTAFAEPQARLLSRFSKKIVVNFDPDTAGAAAAERSLALLVSEDFEIKVLTLEAGFDPDLYIRKKGANAYTEALAHSQKYFDYLIERARALHPVRTPEGKVKALNYLLPHIQRIPSRIVRDEMANEIAHRIGIESSVLRQELRHAATARSSARVNAAPKAQLTDAERVLIRALASPDLAHSPQTAREGQDPDFEPARQAHFFLTQERLHEGLSSQALIDTLLTAHEQGLDPMGLPLDENDRRLVASVLMDDHEDLTPELLENAVRSLGKRRILRQLDDLQHQLKDAERRNDAVLSARLLQERVKLRRAMGAGAEGSAVQ